MKERTGIEEEGKNEWTEENWCWGGFGGERGEKKKFGRKGVWWMGMITGFLTV